MALDLVIRDGLLADGRGGPLRPADVGIVDGTVVEVGEVTGRGRREIAADGRLVTPGFVDVHTHLDAQLAWDPSATSSCWHGVTTVVVGNCGVTFAPVRPGDHGYLAAMMESVEDIPRTSILDGLPWDWEGYGGYLAWLDRIPKGVHVGGMVGHAAVRYYVLGDRAHDEGVVPTPDELAAMAALVREARAAGALGCSTSRTLRHRVPDGRFVPGTWAGTDELVALATAVGPGGIVEVAPRFDGDGPAEPRVDAELAWMTRVVGEVGCRVTFNLTQTPEQGAHFRRAIALAAGDRDARIRPQTSTRPIGLLTGLAHRTPFDAHPEWYALGDLPLAARLDALRDPGHRARLIAAARDDRAGLDAFFVCNEPDGTARYDCTPERSLLGIADARGVSPVEAFVDLALATDGAVVLTWPLLNRDRDAIAEMLADPLVMIGLADSGAHVGQTMDASGPTTLLADWARDSGAMPVEEAVRRLTTDTAATFGIDRGELRPGAVADCNVIDLEALALEVPEYVHDFPGGAGRYVQRSRGYDHTIVAGEVVVDHGEHTGARPGRLVRGHR